jgi:DNA-binding transcriptional MerR regulator/methylmalonyl-CoA mutase cobalamin-binding subunit
MADQVETLTIQQVSQLLGVPAPTIRSWERRYGLAQADRTDAGHRRYNPQQVQALRRMRDAIDRGQKAGGAAILAKTTQARLRAAQPMIKALLTAAYQLEPDQITNTLDAARGQLGLDATIDDVLMPAMRQIGQDWETGRGNITHEHLTTETTRTWLGQITRSAAWGGRRAVILACGPDDHHTLGLEALGALLRQRGWDCRLLGARVPATSLAAAIQQLTPAAVVLVSHLTAGRHSAVDALDMAAEAPQTAQHHQTRLFYAGNAFASPSSRHGVPGTYLGDNLSQAADLITTTSDAAGGAAPTQTADPTPDNRALKGRALVASPDDSVNLPPGPPRPQESRS